METLSAVLLAVFLILCIRQLYFTEPFVEADIKNATVTMSLSDMLYYSGNKGAVQYTSGGSQRLPSISEDNIGYYGGSGGDLGSYLYLKNEMTKQFKEQLKLKNTNGNASFQPTNIEPPSCIQGSTYMETVPLKVPASCSQ
jgi:hypothetical protein